MRIDFLSQPIASQELWLGHQLRSLLKGENGKFDNFYALIAFVKFSGVSRIYSALKAFKDRGGKSKITIGIDHGGTTREGFSLLKKMTDQIFIYHDNSPERRTFHPKIYIFEEIGLRAIIFLGSGNLTAGGLFSNYEAHLRIELTLTDDPLFSEDRRLFQHFMDYCRYYNDTSSPCLIEITELNINMLKLPSEIADKEQKRGGIEDEAEAGGEPAISGLFGSSELPRTPRPDVELGPKVQKIVPSQEGVAIPVEEEVPFVPLQEPAGFWKLLSGNDVSHTSSPGQIIIPIAFRDLFEPLRLTKEPDEGGKGRQWEASFAIEFEDHGKVIIAPDARFIVYEPETGHPRPNTECRFTFRNRVIFDRLEAGDILIFRPVYEGPVRFRVERIGPEDPAYLTLYTEGGRHYNTI